MILRTTGGTSRPPTARDRTVDVVVVTYGSRALLPGCLASVRVQSETGTIVVVDHGDDGAGDIAERLGARVHRNPSNPGFGAGQNAGARRCDAPYLLLLNPDARLLPGALSAGLLELEADSSVGAVQGVIRDSATRLPERSQGRALGPAHLVGRALGARVLLRWRLPRACARRLPGVSDHVDRVPENPSAVAYLAATALLVRRAAFTGVGGFDERYFLYGEDLDLCARLERAGWRLRGLPVAWAEHVGGASAASWIDREMAWWGGTMRYCATWWDTGRWRAGIGAAFVMWIRLATCNPRCASSAWSELIRAPQCVRRGRVAPVRST